MGIAITNRKNRAISVRYTSSCGVQNYDLTLRKGPCPVIWKTETFTTTGADASMRGTSKRTSAGNSFPRKCQRLPVRTGLAELLQEFSSCNPRGDFALTEKFGEILLILFPQEM